MDSERITDMWTVGDIAKAAGVSTAYIRRLLGQGVIKGAVKRGEGKRGIWEIPPHVARAWLEQRVKS